jgi:hypothetical protein
VQVARSKVIAVGLALATALLTFVLWPKSPQSTEDILKQKAVQMARAAEKKELSFILEQVSDRFRSAEGWDKDSLKGVLAAQILRGNWVRVFPVGLDVKVHSSTEAELLGTFVFGRSEATDVRDLPKDSVLNAYAIETQAVREPDGEWRFVSAKHRMVDASDLF